MKEKNQRKTENEREKSAKRLKAKEINQPKTENERENQPKG
jgi:hypothetical protein